MYSATTNYDVWAKRLSQQGVDGVFRVLCHMYDFQKDNEIVKKCVLNTQFITNAMGENVKAIPVIAECYRGNDVRVTTHVVALLNDCIIDASYEVGSMGGTVYYQTLSSFFLDTPELSSDFRKQCISEFVALQKSANQINEGHFLTDGTDYYERQAQYVVSKLST